MIKLVVFDFDGTIADSSPGIFATAKHTMEKLGYHEDYPVETMRRFVGPPLRDCFSIAFSLDESLLDKAVEIYREEYHRDGMYRMSLYPGMKETLIALKERGYKLGVASNKGEATLRSCLGNLCVLDLFDSVHGSSRAVKLTKGDIINLVVSDLGYDKDSCLMVGDTENDRIGAEEAGVAFLGVSYGFGFEKSAERAESPSAILAHIGGKMVEKIETKNAPSAIGPYSQAVKANGMIFASGQIPIDPVAGTVVEGSAAVQAEQCFRNIKEVLKAAGSDISKVVKATVFLKDMNDFAAVNEVYAAAFEGAPVLPARSAVQVGRLPKDVSVEIEVIALQ